MNFICNSCKEAVANPIITMAALGKILATRPRPHEGCKGGTWCDCQCRIGKKNV